MVVSHGKATRTRKPVSMAVVEAVSDNKTKQCLFTACRLNPLEVASFILGGSIPEI